MATIKGSELIDLPSRGGGVPDPNEVIRVSVILRPKTALPAPTAKMAPLSLQEVENRYGADPSAIEQVERFARGVGLTVERSSAAQRTVVLSGTIARMAQAFGVRFANHESARFYEGAIAIPDHLSEDVVAVLGLDNLKVAEPRLRVAKPGAAGSGAPGYSPVDVAKAYAFPATHRGAGECIGLIELGGGYLESDLTTFFHGMGLHKIPKVVAVPVDANLPGSSYDDYDREVSLDIEIAGAVAPKARIAVYFGTTDFQGFLAAITTAVFDRKNRPSVISISWGMSEDSWPKASINAYHLAFQLAGLVGITVFAAAGDDGSVDGDFDFLAHVDFPASDPYVVGCGGTRLTASGATIAKEVVWVATGGGVSDKFELPSWQSRAGVPPSANNQKPGRGVPDVAGNADPCTGYKCVVHGLHKTIGGTSAVAPLYAGLTALINSDARSPWWKRLFKRSSIGGRTLGFITPALYEHGSDAFRDITSGNNGAYQAKEGWDACTGLGSPIGKQLLRDLRSLKRG